MTIPLYSVVYVNMYNKKKSFLISILEWFLMDNVTESPNYQILILDKNYFNQQK